MHRIDTVNARPNQNGAGKAGFNDNTDLAGQDATYLDPAHLNAIQEEVSTVIEATGTPLEKGTNHQLWTALNSFFASNTALDEVDSRLSTAITTLAAAMQQAIINERNAERNRVWPVGKGRYTTHDGLNPADASHLGWGTWALDAEMGGRVAVGAGSITIDYSAAIDDAARPNVTRTFANGETGGEIDHKQQLAELKDHKHPLPIIDATGDVELNDEFDPDSYELTPYEDQVLFNDTLQTDNGYGMKLSDHGKAGGGEPFNVMQPYRVVSVWLRTG
jgi:hypothetical protein